MSGLFLFWGEQMEVVTDFWKAGMLHSGGFVALFYGRMFNLERG
jgi:hypothetical protein